MTSTDKRYQVFISSTFRDLIEERQGVLKAILEMDHMPAGMELFPAGDDSAWRLIADVIDDSDYYVLIIGGRYGSLDENGIGYTEKEYDYALSTNKPVVPLLHANPDNLPRDRTETSEAAWQKLQQFRAKVEKKHTCVYWKNIDELKSKVITGLLSATKRHPAVGWVRADKLPSQDVLSELLALRRRISELETEKASDIVAPPKGTEGLLQGDDLFSSKLDFAAYEHTDIYHRDGEKYSSVIQASWDELFAAVAPGLIDDTPDTELRSAIRTMLVSKALREFSRGRLKSKKLHNFNVPSGDIDTCIVQFRALGLIRESDRQRSVKDTKTYWRLTPYGDHRMTQLRALRKGDAFTEAANLVVPENT